MPRASRFLLPVGLVLLFAAGFQPALAQERVKAAHENLEPGAREDDLGIIVSIPASHPGRRYPASHDFPTGPDVGERLPDFSLANQNGERVDFHPHRGGSKAVVVFYRSAVW